MEHQLVQITCPNCSTSEYRKMQKSNFVDIWVVRCKKCDNMFDANKSYKILGEVIKTRTTQTIVYRDDVGTDQIIEVNEPWSS